MLEILNSGKSRPTMHALATMPYQASHVVTAYRAGAIYTIGGLGTAVTSLNRIAAYNPFIDAWTNMATYPEGVRSSIAGGISDKIVVIGGYNQGPNTKPLTNRVLVSTWSTYPPALTLARREAGYTTTDANGDIYALGGIINDTIGNIFTKYRISGASLVTTALTPYPEVVRGAGVYRDGNKIYACGGFGELVSTLINSFRVYDINTDAWTTLAPLPVTSAYVNMVQSGNYIYAYLSMIDGVYKNALYSYYIPTNTWALEPMPDGPIHGLVRGEAVGTKLYLFGGYDGAGRSNSASVLIVP